MKTVPSDAQKSRYVRDIALTVVVSTGGVLFGLHILRRGDRDGYLLLSLAAGGLYYACYRVFKYIKTYTNWM